MSGPLFPFLDVETGTLIPSSENGPDGFPKTRFIALNMNDDWVVALAIMVRATLDDDLPTRQRKNKLLTYIGVKAA